MQIVDYPIGESGSPGGWRLSGFSSVDELFAFRDERRAHAPENQVLFILDDQGQAQYTSMHASNAKGLDSPDQSLMTAEEWHTYEHELILTPQRYAETLVTNLRACAADSDLANASGRLLPIDAEEIGLVAAHRDRNNVFQDPLLCLSIRGEKAADAIAALPNGYFSGDLDPGENYLVAEQLHEQFDYEILGLGSYLAAYVRPEPFDQAQVTQVIESVRHLYQGLDDDGVAAWAAAAAGRRWFLTHYRGS